MTIAANQLAQILLCSVSYTPYSVGTLATRLHDFTNKKISITYFSRTTNTKDKINDVLQGFEIKKVYDFNKKHTHNILALYLREKGTMFFIDGDRNNSNASASTSGFIHRVEPIKRHGLTCNH